MAPVAPTIFDVDGFNHLEQADRSARIAVCLLQKGYCLVGGCLDPSVLDAAVKETVFLRKRNSFKRPPQEVLSGLLGDLGSAWTHDLEHPSSVGIREDSALRTIDQSLADLGVELAAYSEKLFCMTIQSRTMGVVHHSLLSDGTSNPPLSDASVADTYLRLFTRKKIQVLCYLGPSDAVLTLTPIDDDVESFRCRFVRDA